MTFPPEVYLSSLCSVSLPTFFICGLLDDSYPNRCEVLSYFGFDCIFLVISDFEHLFMCLLAIYLYVFFGKMSIHIFCWSFNSTAFLILICMNCSYILDSNPLLVISLVTIFPHAVGCLFILASFLCSAKPLRLDPLCLFLFLFPLSYEMDQNILLWFMSKSILPMLFPNNFMLFSLTFRPLSILSLLLYIVRKNVSVILLHVAGQFSQHRSLKRLLFLHCIFFFLSDCFD